MKTLITLGVGAVAMYLLDPERGSQRRAMLREQLEKLKTRAVRGSGDTSLETRGALSGGLAADRPTDGPGSAYHLGR